MRLDLALRGVFQVFEIFAVEGHHGRCGDEMGLALALQPLHLLQTALQPFAAAAQGTVDRLRRRGEPALENGQGETDGAGPFVVCQCAGAVKLLADVLGYRRIEPFFLCGQFVGDSVGMRSGKRGVLSNLSSFSLTMRRMRSETSTL